MDVFGSFALILAFVCAVYAFVGGIAAIITRHPLLIKSARQAGIAVCALIFTATLSLVYLFFTDNYSVAYVVSHSNRDLSTFFKVAALWSGQEGSLLFWSFLLAIYVISVLLTYRNKNGELMPYVGVILAGVALLARNWGGVLQAGLSIASIIYGSLLGVFLLGLLTRRVGEIAAMCGMVAGLALMLYVRFATPIAFTWYVLIGTSMTFVTGILASFLLKETPSRAAL